jgi:hypothetical protein
MRIYGEQVFDDIISGTTSAWYTSARFDDLLGTADMLAVMAISTAVAGTSPQLALSLEHSADGRHWNELATGVYSLTNDGTYFGQQLFWPAMLARVRFRVSLTGTNPSCRLRLLVTGRTF